jgi:hypothetical protein
MGFQITNISKVERMFELVGTRVPQEARNVVKFYAQEIVKTAKWYAPVDEYRLTRAIKLLPSRGNAYSLRMTIVVSGVIDGRSVDSYAARVHSYPWYKRGPRTRAKGPQAGPRYLSRAMEDHKKKMIAALEKAMQKGIQDAVRSSGVNAKTRGKRK